MPLRLIAFFLLLELVSGGQSPPSAAAPSESLPPSKPDDQTHSSALEIPGWSLPPSIFLKANQGFEPIPRWEPRDGVKQLSQETHRYDVRERLKLFGAAIPPEGEATYFESNNALIVRAPRNVLDLIDTLAGRSEEPFGVRISISIGEFSPSPKTAEASLLGLSELRKAAGESWKVTATLAMNTPSGTRAIAECLTPGAAGPKTLNSNDWPTRGEMPELKPGEAGIRAEVEPIIQPDGITCDLNLSCRWRIDPAGPEARLITGLSARDGVPLIAQITRSPEKNGKERAVVVRVDVIGAGGWSIHEKSTRGSNIDRATKL